MRLWLFPLAALAAVAVVVVARPLALDAGHAVSKPRAASPAAAAQRPAERPRTAQVPKRPAGIRWRRSVAVGSPSAGSLIRGVQLPARGANFSTWDPNLRRSPDRGWRRWGTNRLVRVLLAVSRQYRAAHPAARPLLVGDLSRPHGGNFGRQYGYVFHNSHQNGLDADVYYPRTDRVPREPRTAADINRRLAQDLLNRFVRAGATKVFVGPNTRLTGPAGVVQVIPYHDNHMHVRIGP
jgi:murein endopeptidase